MDDLKATYDRIAKNWAKDHEQDTWWVAGTDRFVSYLKPGDTILDVGCGSGYKSKYLIAKGFRVVGVDFSAAMIELARTKVPEGRFFVMDMKDLGGLRDFFSAVFAQASLLHIPKNEIAHVLGELRDKLTPHGYLYIAVKELQQEHEGEEIVTENDYGYAYSRFFSYFTMDELEEYLKHVKMNIVYADKILSGKTTWLQVIAQK